MDKLDRQHPIIHWFIHNGVTANLLMLGILLSGLYMVGFFGLGGMVSKLPLEAFPLVETNVINVSASLNGSTPEDVEQGVTNKIEDALQTIQGIDEMTSKSSANTATVSVAALPDYDMDTLLDDVKSAVDLITGLPAEVEKIQVAKRQRQRSILWVTLSGDVDEKALDSYAERLKQGLLNNRFVENVERDGEKAREMTIEIPAERLEEYGLTLQQVAAAIDSGSIDLSSGQLATSQGNVGLRLKSQAADKNTFGDIIVNSQADGATLRVRDIATIKDGFVEGKSISEFNGETSVTLRLYSSENANVIEADKAATAIVNDFKAQLPQNITITIWNNRVDSVRDRIDLFLRNASTGVLLVFLLLTLFLNIKLAFWVALGIPISFAGALLSMGFMGISINLITLFGFIVVLGIVVDDAIVIGESIYTWKKRTNNAPDATLRGTGRVSTAATFGVLTTVAAFLPLTQISGGFGSILGQIGWVVIFCLLFSLVESKLILPSHLHPIRVSLKTDKPSGGLFRPWVMLQTGIAGGLEWFAERVYLPVLSMVLNLRYFTVMVFIALFVLAIGTIMGGILKVARFPKIEAQSISLSVTMDNTVNADTTLMWAKKAADALRQADKQLMAKNETDVPNVTHISVTNSSDTQFRVRAGLASAEVRTIDAQQIANRWRETLGLIPGAKNVNFAARRRFSRSDIDIQLLGYDADVLNTAAQAVMDELSTISGTKDIANSEESVSKEIRIDMKPEAAIYGITRAELAKTLRSAFYGVQAERFQRGTDEVRVMVRYPENERQSIASLERFVVQTQRGQAIPISAVADLSFASSPTSIFHLDKQRVISVYADVDNAITSADAIVEQLQATGFLDDIAQQYELDVRLGGEAKEGRQSDNSMKMGFILSLVMIYVLLAIALKSYSQPLIIMSVIPFGIIGAIVGHLLIGIELTMISFFGIIALSGVVVNDSLLLVSTIQQHRDENMPLLDAIRRTGVRRFRPVLLTSVTTFAGLMPMLFETSFQAQFLVPMAVSLGFGILFATVITLLLVPALYAIFNDVRRLFYREIVVNAAPID